MHAEMKREMLADAAVRAAYEALEDEFAIIDALVRARARAGLSQAELARRMGTTQSAIARLEGGKVMPMIATLRRYAEATGSRLSFRMDMI
ncbi:MAG: helix-turn-helix domain-containing protein, partial [Rhodothalassiaceae bacterium]